MIKALFALIVLFFVSSCAVTKKTDKAIVEVTEDEVVEGIIQYECYSLTDYDKEEILVLAFAEEHSNEGAVGVFGELIDAHYQRTGFNHRWDFDDYQYAFIIRPNGFGVYYDFTIKKEGVKGSMFFDCE